MLPAVSGGRGKGRVARSVARGMSALGARPGLPVALGLRRGFVEASRLKTPSGSGRLGPQPSVAAGSGQQAWRGGAAGARSVWRAGRLGPGREWERGAARACRPRSATRTKPPSAGGRGRHSVPGCWEARQGPAAGAGQARRLPTGLLVGHSHPVGTDGGSWTGTACCPNCRAHPGSRAPKGRTRPQAHRPPSPGQTRVTVRFSVRLIYRWPSATGLGRFPPSSRSAYSASCSAAACMPGPVS